MAGFGDEPNDRDLDVRLRAAIDDLPTARAPARLVVRRPSRPWRAALRLIGAAGVAGVALVLALVVGVQIGEHRAASSPQPTGLVVGDRYGIVALGAGGPIVRAESDPTPLATLYAEPIHRGVDPLSATAAVSPDGHRIAYWIWDTSPPGLGSLSLERLALYDTSTGTTQELLRLSTEAASGVVWSTDGTGLLFAVWRPDPGYPDGPSSAQLRTLDLASGAIHDVGPVLSSPHIVAPPFGVSVARDANLRPLLWDRSSDRIVAVESVGNTSYATGILLVDHGSPRSYALDGAFLSTIALSSDGTMLAGARTSDFALVAWPVTDYGARQELVPGTGERILSFTWRPRSDQLFFVHDNALMKAPLGANWSRLEVWRPGIAPARVVDPSGGPIVFRLDGTAYFIKRGADLSAPTEVIETDSGRQLASLPSIGPVVTSVLLPATAAPRQTALPPAAVITETESLRRTGAEVLRVDRTSLTQTTKGDILARSGSSQSGPVDKTPAWVFAILGQIHPSFGLLPLGPSPCGLFFINEDGAILGSAAGSLALCQPYFADSLVPGDAPLSCPAPFTYGVELTEQRATRAGPIALDIGRDDAWRRSTTVPGAFLVTVVPGDITYQKVLCRDAYATLGTAFRTTDAETFMLGQVVRPTVAQPPPGRDYQVWLKDLHVRSASADDQGTLTFVVERRPGFEMVGYDPSTVLVQPTGGGYLRYRFVDAAGADVIPFIMDNIP
jgi:hypothetical protein